MTIQENFADRLSRKIKNTANIIVGIDPDFSLMPADLRPRGTGPVDVTHALEQFGAIVIDAVHDLIPAVKFQSAYYERFGVAGAQALSRSMLYARAKNLEVILDAKRGDIGSTSLAYAEAYLSGKTFIEGVGDIASGLEADCLTINPFLGEDSLQPFADLAHQHGKGLFILVKTSNAGSAFLQDLPAAGHASVSEKLAAMVSALGKSSVGASGYSCIGAVIGATYPEEAAALRRLMPRAIHLVPGLGTQGGTIETALANIDENGLGAVISVSRAATYPAKDEIAAKSYSAAIRDRTAAFIAQLRAAQNNRAAPSS